MNVTCRLEAACAFSLAALVAALFFAPGEARAQATGYCMPTQTVSATAGADGVYTTTLVCADTSAAAGEADYRQLHYNHGTAYGANPADRNANIANNDVNNHLSFTLGNGVVLTADKYMDHRTVPTDGAIVLWNAGAGDKTVTVQEGAVINLERTPEYWHPTTDADRRVVRMEGGDVVYDPDWYPSWTNALDSLTAIAAHSNTGDGDSDITVRLDGEINIDINVGGTYGKNDRYDASAGRAIDVQIKDTGASGDARADLDALVELGPTGVIRQVEGSDGLGGIYVENRSEEGDITINLAEGSLIDVSEGGGYGILAIGWTHGNNNGSKTGDMIINAAGTIRTALPQGRVQSNNFGHGIFASQGADGRLLVTSSGTIEAVQASAIDARAYRSTNMHSDDPDTPEIEGHLVDVTAGTVESRGNTAIYTSTGSINADMTVRVAAGATVRAQALTPEDYENGASTQAELGTTGNGRLQVPRYRFYGWRQVQVMREVAGEMVEVTVSEPIIVGVAMRDYTSAAAAEGVMDQMLVDGTVEAIGGKADVDPAIWMERGGRLVVGATGRVSADSGLGIEAGCVSEYRSGFTDPAGATTDCDSKPPRNLEVTVAGTVKGDIRLRGDGDLTATVAGTVDGDIRTMGAGALALSVREGGVVTGTVRDPVGLSTVVGSIGRLLYTSGATVTVARTGALTGVEGETEAISSESGDLDLTVAGRVAGDLRAPSGGTLTLDVKEGGTVTGTVHDPVGLSTVVGSIGRLLYANGGTVTVGGTGKLTGVEGETEAISSESGALSLTVNDKGMVTGDVQARGDDGRLTLDVKEGGTVTGTVHDPVGLSTVVGSIGRLLYASGATVTVARTGALTGVEVDGRRQALRSAAGDLDLTVAGMVTGDVLGLGNGDHMVTVERGGTVRGTIRLAASTVRVDGSVDCVRLDRGGAVTVGAGGRIACADGVGIRGGADALTVTVAGTVNGVAAEGDMKVDVTNTGRAGDINHAGGDLDLTIHVAEGELPTATVDRASGQITGHGDRTVQIVTADGTPLQVVDESGMKYAAPLGARDVELTEDGKLKADYAPRSRVYEALPSMLLGLNAPPAHRDRFAGQRSPNGTWGRAKAGGGERRARRSTSSSGIVYDHRSYGVQAGVEFPLRRAGLMGVSMHHRRGTATLSGGDGKIEASGIGLGLSGAWMFGGEVYVDGQLEATWYEMDLSSGRRGPLKSGAKGFGWAAGLEAGRRVGLGFGPLGEMTLTPRARLARSNVEVDAFTDKVGGRVSVEGGRSLSGRAGVELESSDEGGNRLFGSVELEREFWPDTRTEVSGEGLSSEGVDRRVLAELGVVRSWGEGRYALQGVVRYAAARSGNRDYGGGLSLSVGF